MILVVGATGLLGGEICRRLRTQGRSVRALVRPGSPRAEELRDLGIECVDGDLKRPDSIRAACRGARAVVTTANSALSRRRGDSIRTVDLLGHIDLVAAAKEAGVARFVYTSVTPALSASSPFVQAKRQVEEIVRSSGMDWTILQPCPFMEISFSKLAGWDLDSGQVTLLGAGAMPVSYVSLRDVAGIAILTLERKELTRRAIPIGGPDALAPQAAVRVFEESLGRSLRVRRIPLPVVRAIIVALRPFDPIRSSLMTMAVEAALRGDVQDSRMILDDSIHLTSVRDYAAHVAGGGIGKGSA